MLRSRRLDPNGNFETNSWLERVIVIGLDKRPSKVTLSSTCKYFCFQNGVWIIFFGKFKTKRGNKFFKTKVMENKDELK